MKTNSNTQLKAGVCFILLALLLRESPEVVYSVWPHGRIELRVQFRGDHLRCSIFRGWQERNAVFAWLLHAIAMNARITPTRGLVVVVE
jgi:hypothetical protein